jgi:S-adenosylmethionine/arginine decarboxylase-like enzyme
MNTKEYWGYHISLELGNCDVDAVNDPDYLNAWVKQLVKDIDMVAYGEPQVVHFADNCPIKAGWTVSQLIETSNIMVHFIDSGDAYVDIFSCKPFAVSDVLSNIQDWFNPEEVDYNFRVRQARKTSGEKRIANKRNLLTKAA